MGETDMFNELVLSQTDFAGCMYTTALQSINGKVTFHTNEKVYELADKWLISINCNSFLSLYTDASRTSKFLYEVSYLHTSKVELFINEHSEGMCA